MIILRGRQRMPIGEALKMDPVKKWGVSYFNLLYNFEKITAFSYLI